MTNNDYRLYLGAYNRNRRRMFVLQHQLRCARKLLDDRTEVVDEENREYLIHDIHKYEDEILEIRARMHYLESNAERNGFDLRRRK